MNFTVSTVAQSLADFLAPSFPGVTFFQNPNQQQSLMPCMFLQQRYSELAKEPSGRYLRTIGLDLTYLEDYNLPNLQQLYQQAAEQLDILLDTFPYSDGTATATIRAYERSWKIDLDGLHYAFEIRAIVSLPESEVLMQSMDYSEDVTNG